MSPSSIAWTDYTSGPVTGCDKVSPGCEWCYSESGSVALQGFNNPSFQNGFDLTLHPRMLERFNGVKNGVKCFVCSMSDIMHRDISVEYLNAMFQAMNAAPQHTYQILTKRARHLREIGPHLPWGDHMWMGVSVENDEPIGKKCAYAPTDRIDDLRASGAKVKWISAEPLIGPLPNLDLTGIDWMVIGGESGVADEIREMKLEWVRDLIAQCRAAGVAPFVKQMGTHWAHATGTKKVDHKGEDPSVWPEDLRVREFPVV